MSTTKREGDFLLLALASREQRHRRTALLALGALIVLSTSPVIGHHLSRGADVALLSGRDHLWGLCLAALHMLLAPVHGAFHLLLLAGLAFATWDRVCASRALRRSLAIVDAISPEIDDAFWTAAGDAGLDPERLRVIVGLPNPAFTAGWFQPVVYVAAELDAVLTQDELVAVLAHEAEHVRRHDPLRLSLLRFLARTLFWIPALGRLAADLADEAEVAADDAAVRGRIRPVARVTPAVLASAILTLAGWSDLSSDLGPVTAFQRADLLDRRIRRLIGEDTRVGTHLTRRSLGGALTALAAVWASGLIMAHPLPAAGTGSAEGHCMHHHSMAVMHLFCLESGVDHRPGSDCPHSQNRTAAVL